MIKTLSRRTSLSLFFLGLVPALIASDAGNLLRNAGFEDGNLGGWYWGTKDADARIRIDREEARSGSHSVRIANATPRAPHVYAGLHQTVRELHPNTEYVISVWVKGVNSGRGFVGGGAGWRLREPLPTGTFDWRRVELRHTTGPSPENFQVILFTEDITEALWVDDFDFRPADKPPSAVGAQAVSEPNLVKNPGFETGSLQGWGWGVNRDALASAAVDAAESHSGGHALKLTNRSHRVPNLYGVLRQRIPDIKPNTRYTLSAWVKATATDRGWIGGGPAWKIRLRYPAGTYDWQRITTTFETGDQADFELVIVTEGPTEALWVDDISLREASVADAPETAQLFPAAPADGIPPGTRFYPLFAAGPGVAPPVVRIRAGEQPVFGADVTMTTSPEGLFFLIDVIDPDPFKTADGEAMWNGDSIQIAIDSRGASGDLGNTNTYYEIGFAWPGPGPVATHAWVGNFNWVGVVAAGERTDLGYRLGITIPWRNLSLDPAHLPPDIGLNIVVNDRGLDSRRRFVEWTPSTARAKNAALFARAVFAPAGQNWMQTIFPGRETYDRGQSPTGRLIEYALDGVPASELALAWRRQGASDESAGGAGSTTLRLPALEPNRTRATHFSLPAAGFADEGRYDLAAAWRPDRAARPSQRVVASVRRVDLGTRIAAELAAAKARLEEVRRRWSAEAETSPYTRLGLEVAVRFVERVERLQAQADAQPWSLLQLEELREVFASLESAPRPSRPLPPLPARVAIGEGGVFEDADTGRPFYFYGYGHFSRAFQDMPLLSKLGATLIQQEKGPNSLDEDGRIRPAVSRFISELMTRADASGTKVDFLLSPHYMPAWVLAQAPEARLPVASGFGKYNIDHPLPREAIGRWIRTVLPLLKDSPSLLSVCLANEPTYAHSGRDDWSRGAWTGYLRERHGDIENLNTLYGATYLRFEDVPAPEAVRPGGPEAQRAWYDWVRFNQRHLASWIGWMNDEVKAVAPGVFTHAKVMANIFKRSYIAQGTDPELICAVTDLAGNDAWAYDGVSRRYAYDWQSAQMWYDLLHSFRGQPVYNSENHFIRDSAPPVHIPPAHTRSILWQGAIHHQGATALWVWDEPRDHDVSGNISLRPANAYAAGRTMLDLRRLSAEVAALSRTPARVAMLYSVPSIFWNEAYAPTATAAYTALMFAGQPVTFISERQLAAGERSSANAAVDILILPQATHVPEETLRGLAGFAASGGRILAIGEGNLAGDEYGRPRRIEPALAQLIVALPLPAEAGGRVDVARELGRALQPHLPRSGAWQLVDSHTGVPAWGVEHRVAPYEDGHLLTMTNMLPESVDIRVERTGEATDAGEALDLFSERPVALGKLILAPMEPRLLFLKHRASPR